MSDYKISDSDLLDLLIHPKLKQTGKKKHYICDCVFCGKPKHMYVNKDTQNFDCKKCGESGTVIKLLKHFNKTYLLQGSTVEQTDFLKSIKKSIEEIEQTEIEELPDIPVISMPAGSKIAINDTYLFSRKLNNEEIIRYDFRKNTLFDKYKDYVLVPIYENKKIRGFLGRYANGKVPEDKLRYNNSRGTNFSHLLFGIDEINSKTVTVILVEGIFDKIAVDRFLKLNEIDEIKCCCTFGKKISETQISKLKIKGVINVILLYDFDAIKQIKKYGIELEKDFVTFITYTSKKDIDLCTESEAFEVFQNLKKPKEFNMDVIGALKK